MRVYGDQRSGNCYKIKLVCALLKLPLEWSFVDILANEAASDSFRAINPNGKVPALQLDDGRCLWESNAIINFIAHDSPLLPNDAFALATVQQWQFFEQYSHEPYIAVARFINQFQGRPPERESEYQGKQEGGHRALRVMEQRLAESPFLAGDHLSTADISLYAYTHVADEGGFDLGDYGHIRAWLERVATQPGYVSMLE